MTHRSGDISTDLEVELEPLNTVTMEVIEEESGSKVEVSFFQNWIKSLGIAFYFDLGLVPEKPKHTKKMGYCGLFD